MSVRVQVERFGTEATDALADRVATLQAGDRLARVTVIVPRNYTGLAVRRALASRRPIANVELTTLARIADQLGGPPLHRQHRRPVAPALLAAAARAALAEEPGIFADVAEHPATEAAIVRAHDELRSASTATLDRLAAQSPRAREVVRLVRALRRRLADWYDETDLVESATAVLRTGRGADRQLGAVVLFLPDHLDGTAVELIRALAEGGELEVILGLTGDPEADAATQALAERIAPGGAVLLGRAPDAPGPALADAVVSAPSADTEVHAALRMIMARRRAGTPLHRMAIAYTTSDPYARLVLDAVHAAGLPHNGPAAGLLAQTVAGRALLGLLDLPRSAWRRDAVIAWLSTNPVLDRGRPVPATAWDRLSAAAGVVHGLDQWSTRLDAFTASLDDQLAKTASAGSDDVEQTERRRDRLERDRSRATALASFVGRMAGMVAGQPRHPTWSAWAKWADGLLLEVLGPPARHGAWPAGEDQAFDSVRQTLQRLAVLDTVEESPDLDRFRRALAAELDAPAQQTGRFGVGLLVSPVRALWGLDLDTVIVVGMNEGAFPPAVRDDGILPDAERAVAGDEVPLRRARTADERRSYLAALGSARERILSHARCDQRRGREQLPSRWLLESAGHLAGATVHAGDLAGLHDVEGIHLLSSHAGVVRSIGEPFSLHDYDLRDLLLHVEAGAEARSHPLCDLEPRIGRGLDLLAARAGSAFTRFDGLAPNDAIADPTAGRPVSPTSLETYAACPRRYLLGRVLHVELPEHPEEILRISATERGSLVHRVLERFIEQQTERPGDERIRPTRRWTDADRATLLAIADDEFIAVEKRGMTGLAVLWELDRAAIIRDLLSFLDADDRRRAEGGLVPESVELGFGVEGQPAVPLELGDGRVVEFKGIVDRVDRALDGSVLVTDYKTGGHYSFRAIEQGDDPLVRGTKLQLAIYGLAARHHWPDSAGVRSEYWFTSERGAFKRIGYDVDDQVLDRLAEVTRTIVDGIGAGLFPARPGDSDANCKYCDYDALCPPDRGRSWERKRGAGSLIPFLTLTGEQGSDEGDTGDAGTEGEGEPDA